MVLSYQVRLSAFLLLVCWFGSASGQLHDSPVQDLASGAIAAGKNHPFGQRNPDAPPELEQFAFLVGHFDRRERRRNPSTGEWSAWGDGEKTASWIMDGRAILDEHVNFDTGEAVGFIRTFDSQTGRWHHVRVSMPDFRLTEAEGAFIGNEYFNDSEFVDAQGRSVFQQYVFYDIKPDGYRWRAQRTIDDLTFTYWEIEYSRTGSAGPRAANTGGSINPAAPPELRQFDFMVGDFKRKERHRNPDGSWGEWQEGEWNARYFLNGFGIIDESVNHDTGVSTSNLRIFDPEDRKWKVTWVRLPDYKRLMAEGARNGTELVLSPPGSEHKYVFSDITPNSYRWTLQVPLEGEYVSVFEIVCQRKAPLADDLFESVEHGYIDSDGVSLHYVTMGEGPLLVMLHGFPDFWYTWRNLMPSLAGQYRVVALDLRGYNLSDQPEGVENYAMPKLIGDVVATIRYWGGSPVVLLGHDWGGAIAWQVAMRHPELIEKLIILSTPHPVGLRRELGHNPKQQKQSQYAVDFQSPDAYRSITTEDLAAWVKDPVARPRYLAAFERSDVRAMLNYYQANFPKAAGSDSLAALTSQAEPLLVQAPTLAIFGLEDSALLPAGFNDTWDRVAAELTLVAIPGAGHFIQHDAADAVLATVLSWLNKYP